MTPASPAPTPPANPHPGISQREFAILVALIMGVGALGVDLMLPALPQIGAAMGLDDPNRAQMVIVAYSLGFGIAQPIFGPLADRYGRKPVLFAALIIYAMAGVASALATSFTVLIAARTVAGMMAASTRVIVTSVVRDCYTGRHMARVMSMAQMIFFAIPILAPSIGAVILLVAPWQATFAMLTLLAVAIAFWTKLRLPETLRPEDRRAIAIAPLREAWIATLTTRISIGYTLASTCTFGALLGYINSSEQIIAGQFGRADAFPIAFAGVALGMGIANFVNARAVVAIGTRRMSHGALIALIAFSAAHVAMVALGHETLTSFLLFQTLQMAMLGMIGANFSAMAMEPVGHFAGTAASVQGFVSGVGAALIGLAVGQAYDGTTMPVAAGFLLMSLTALVLVFLTEGRLFKAHHEPGASAGQ